MSEWISEAGALRRLGLEEKPTIMRGWLERHPEELLRGEHWATIGTLRFWNWGALQEWLSTKASESAMGASRSTGHTKASAGSRQRTSRRQRPAYAGQLV